MGQSLTASDERADEQFRRLLAYEIHDGFVQHATGAMMHLETVIQTGCVPDGSVRNEIGLCLELIRKAVAEARQLIGGLRPPLVEEQGVVGALRYLIDDQPPGGPSIEFEANVQFDRLEPLLETVIYRITQEAITNLRRHSKSARAVVRLVQVGDRVSIEIRDWGIGFFPNGDEVKRFGLRGIRERARLLGGRAVIDSTPGQGTRVVVDLPLAGLPGDVATT